MSYSTHGQGQISGIKCLTVLQFLIGDVDKGNKTVNGVAYSNWRLLDLVH